MKALEAGRALLDLLAAGGGPKTLQTLHAWVHECTQRSSRARWWGQHVPLTCDGLALRVEEALGVQVLEHSRCPPHLLRAGSQEQRG